MSLSRRQMIYGLAGLAGMSRNLSALSHHHHAPQLDPEAVQAFVDASGGAAESTPGVTGQGDLKFRVLYTSDHLPAEARKGLDKIHGGFAVDRRAGKDDTYFSIPGAGIVRVSGDMKTVTMIETPDEMRKVNLHDSNIWYGKDGTAYLVFPSNDAGKIFTTTLDGKLVHTLDAPTANDAFERQEVHDYFLGGGNFAPTAVEYMEGLYYVTTGYCNLDYVLTARVTPEEHFEAVWNDLAWGGRGDGIGQFRTGHGITKPPGKMRLDVADRPASRFERFTKYGHFLSQLSMPSGCLPCDVNYLNSRYSVVPALQGPDKTKGAPIYLLDNDELVSTIMIKEDLGLPNFKQIHNAALRLEGAKLYIIAQSFSPGDFAILEQV